MSRMRVGMKSTCYVVLLFGAATSSLAQTATLRGQVTDESGGVIPRANVTLTGTGGQVTTTAADDIGAYSFSGVAVGNYTVQASAPALSTDSSSNASAVVLRGDDLQALSDDPDDLAADLQALAGPSAGPNGGSIFVDGFSGGQLPSKESIREIRINQNPFSPEYDKLGYGKIEIFTKPGSDKYRGTAQWNFADDFWNTRNPYSP